MGIERLLEETDKRLFGSIDADVAQLFSPKLQIQSVSWCKNGGLGQLTDGDRVVNSEVQTDFLSQASKMPSQQRLLSLCLQQSVGKEVSLPHSYDAYRTGTPSCSPPSGRLPEGGSVPDLLSSFPWENEEGA